MFRVSVLAAAVSYAAIMVPHECLAASINSAVDSIEGAASHIQRVSVDKGSELFSDSQLEPKLVSSQMLHRMVFDQPQIGRGEEHGKHILEDVTKVPEKQAKDLQSPVSGWGYLLLACGVFTFVFGVSRGTI